MHSRARREVLLVQLPIPPLGPGPIRGNVPLAAAYLKHFAEAKRLDSAYAIELFPPRLANTLGDQALVAALLERDPWLVGFTCYLWNIERTLWIAHELKRQKPQLRIVLGGPEITPDNAWVLDTPDYDFAAIGEGEQTFAQLLSELQHGEIEPLAIPGLYVPPARSTNRYDPGRRPAFRTPLADLNQLGSPYLAGILNAADEEMLLLETTRGCVFKCKFCYYPKSYDRQYYLGSDQILANLAHARDRGAREVFLLDPTLNQRKDFADLLRILARGNPDRSFTYFGELRGEGITEETARLLRQANFTEVEVGLQSIDPDAQQRMDRKNNLRAFERGVRAMLTQGIAVKVDLIIGLPGDTAASIRRGLHYLRDNGLYSDVQVFNLSILPGTAFRQEASALGLRFQPRPPYYVLDTPSLTRQELYGLMSEAQELLQMEFDPQPPPVLQFDPESLAHQAWRLDLDRPWYFESSPSSRRAQAFTLWLKSANFQAHALSTEELVLHVLHSNPFTTLQLVLEPADPASRRFQDTITSELLAGLARTCHANPTYLDRYYAFQPGRPNGAKRVVVLLPAEARTHLDAHWLEELAGLATIVWRSPAGTVDGSVVGVDEQVWAS
jgi:radical SAM superfamily enzyme YgiQ (UPF0313 family)